jgi:hypothetical protein
MILALHPRLVGAPEFDLKGSLDSIGQTRKPLPLDEIPTESVPESVPQNRRLTALDRSCLRERALERGNLLLG